MRWLTVCITAFALLHAIAGGSRSSQSDYETIIASSDLVVHAIVRGIAGDEVPIQDFMPGDPRTDARLNIVILDLEVREVLKGYHTGANFSVVVPKGIQSIGTNYNIGDEIVLPLIFWKFMRGGSFMVTNDGARFLKVGNQWVRQLNTSRSDPPMAVPFTNLRETGARYAPDAVIGRATVAAVGRVEGITSRNERGALVEEIRMDVLRSMKGLRDDDEITFRATRRLGDLKWQTIVPQFVVGEEWIVFLARDEDGFFVLDGTNGVFRVNGDAVVQADRVELPMSTTRFVARMAEVSGHE